MTLLESELSLYDQFELIDLDEYDIDLKPFIHELYIVEKGLGVSKLADVIHPAQDTLIDYVSHCLNTGKSCRVIILKARQIGISTIIEALCFAMAKMIDRLRGMVIAHEAASSEHLLSMSQTYYDEFFARAAYTQKNKSAKILSWVETKSQISISTAKNTGSGRSRTIHFLHGSEVAFWDNADILMTGLAQSVPDTPLSFIFMESTANGIGNYFHIAWEEACRGENDYQPLFFPWWTHPEYKASLLGLPPVTGGFDKEERQLIRLLKNPPKERWNFYQQEPLDNHEILDRLAWRRWCIKNKCKSDLHKFHQEYPSTPEEAFISTGTNVFPKEALDKRFDFIPFSQGDLLMEAGRVRFQKNRETGKLKIFKNPTKGAEYIVAGDPKKATEGDYACAQVLNRRTWEQVAVYRDKVDPVTFGEVMMNLGLYFNRALLAPEIEGGGYATIGYLLSNNYPFIWQHEKSETMPGQVDNWFGWHTNWKTKNQALGILKKVIIDGMITLHDRETYAEMKNYVSLPGNKFGNGELVDHDDMVMALAIAMAVTWYTQMDLSVPDLQPGDTPYTPSSGRPARPVAPDPQEPVPQPGSGAEVPAPEANEDALPEDVVEQPPWMSWGEEGHEQ